MSYDLGTVVKKVSADKLTFNENEFDPTPSFDTAYKNVQQFEAEKSLAVEGDTLLHHSISLGNGSAAPILDKLQADLNNPAPISQTPAIYDVSNLNAGVDTSSPNAGTAQAAPTTQDKIDALLSHSGTITSAAGKTLYINNNSKLEVNNGTWTNGDAKNAANIQLSFSGKNTGNLHVGAGATDADGNAVESAAKLDFGTGTLTVKAGCVKVGHEDADAKKVLYAELDLSKAKIDTSSAKTTVHFSVQDKGLLKLDGEQLGKFTVSGSKVATRIGAGGTLEAVHGNVDGSQLVHDRLDLLTGKINFTGTKDKTATLYSHGLNVNKADNGIEIGEYNTLKSNYLNFRVTDANKSAELKSGNYVANLALSSSGDNVTNKATSNINVNDKAHLILGQVTQDVDGNYLGSKADYSNSGDASGMINVYF